MCKKLTAEEFIEKAKQIHGHKYDYSKVEYLGCNVDICIICPIHGEFWQKPYKHLSGQGCKKCVSENQSLKRNFIEKARRIHGDKYDYSKVEYINAHTKIRIICPIHGEFLQTPNGHIYQKQGCPKCKGKNKTTEDFITEAQKVHGYKYDYSKVEYINAQTKVCIICPIHGEFLQTPDNHLRGKRCPKCKQSLMEEDIARLLKKQSISYELEKQFPWLSKQRLDFYLPQYNLAIECQGMQHFKPIEYFGGEEKFKYTIKMDKQKEKICTEHGVKILYYSNIGIPLEDKIIKNKEELLNEILKHGKVKDND